MCLFGSLSARWSTGARSNQLLEFRHKLGNVFKLQIHRSKSNIGDLVELFQAPHDHLSNLTRRALTLGRFLHIFLYSVHNALELRRGYRSFFTSAQQARHYFVAIERLAPAVFLDDHVRDLIDTFVRREAPLTTQALAPAANRVAFARLTRVDDFVFEIATERTFHS